MNQQDSPAKSNTQLGSLWQRLIRNFTITGWKRALYAFVFILLLWRLLRFWGSWKEGVCSVFYVVHAPIHEVGHAVARMMRLPEVAVVLAGSVFQILTPVAIGVYFVWHGDCPALSLCLGWLGFATIEMAAYMHDAPFGNLTLVAPFSNGDNIIHDFKYLFMRWNCLESAVRISEVTASIGYVFIFAALALIIAMFILGFMPKNATDLSPEEQEMPNSRPE